MTKFLISPADYEDAADEDGDEPCDGSYGCDHECRMVSGVPTCFCNEGYHIEDVTACVDDNECRVDNGGCVHECINKPGTYTCRLTIKCHKIQGVSFALRPRLR